VSSGKCIQTLEGHSYRVIAVSWSSDDTRICSGSFDGTVRVWEVSSGKCMRAQAHFCDAGVVSWSNDDSRICSGGADNTMRVWAVSTGECLWSSEGLLFDLRFSSRDLAFWSAFFLMISLFDFRINPTKTRLFVFAFCHFHYYGFHL